ncbi:hypothetical protein [Bacillus sp. MUM 13]|uniref:hypothetical protein n=1 Tax=Bacillus sp. MUM 13 TaxID=1678001 RepID=UPI0008F5908A|nr:hypothetical protein [Bacillus sp. MUM 13]OIK11951.1 hypothetical protein BIV59_10545 [Bacillus sp. MUM 13]
MKSKLLLSADTPEQLRPIDVDRVMMAACEQGCFKDFKDWLISHRLQERTWQLVKEFTERIAKNISKNRRI